MKFPLPKNLFPPLELSENQEACYEHLANALIKATLAEYDQFVMHDRKRVDTKRWKSVRTRDGVSIYRERVADGERQPAPATLALYQSAISTMSSRPSQNARRSGPFGSDSISLNSGRGYRPSSPRKNASSSDPTEDSRDTTGNDSYGSGGLLSEPRITTAAYSSLDDDNSSGLPRLLAVGTLRGSLDDVMYGVVSPNASSVRLRSSYLGEHIADCAILREIKSPSPADPFRFLGIKWFVRAKHRGAARIVLPRDFVVLEFSGVMMRPDNSRVGFHLMHSVEIPTCRELHEHRILRAKLSSCYIFEETRNNRVQICNRCRIVRKLSSDTLNSQITTSTINFCKKCVASVSDESALEIARQELWNYMLNTYSTSAGRMSGTALSNDALSLDDLGMDSNKKAAIATEKEKPEGEEPVVLDHRMTMTIRSLRHLDYVLSVGEQDLVDELDNEDFESEDYGEFECEEESEMRSSYASSVAVLDDDYESCSEAPQSQREMPIVEGEEDDGSDAEQEPEEENAIQADKPKSEASKDSEKKLSESDKVNEVAELAQGDKLPEAKDEPVSMAVPVPEDGDEDEEVEVVEAAPIAQVHAMMLSQYELQKANKTEEAVIEAVVEDVAEDPQPRLQRAHTTVPSSGDSNYQNQLFQQMQDLHSVAESTYQVARAQTEAAFKERDSGRVSKASPESATNLRGVQPFAFNVVGLRSTRAMTVGFGK
ncbi:hypothetical protein PHMEG_00025669 [Phytophthora megakarya]|uniref:Uncharacterized protein n=1 Tax=Phytophthora megakarya TaxID=4795 RepID=A0A225VBH3_9STRA|nr:hypothetical protein PHMEG_00025669 [Phytophthora megakarya]